MRDTWRLDEAGSEMHPRSMNLILPICGIAVAASLGMTVIARTGTQPFAAAAMVKMVALPATYLVIIVGFCRMRSLGRPPARTLIWAPALLGIVGVSLTVEIGASDHASVISLAQDACVFLFLAAGAWIARPLDPAGLAEACRVMTATAALMSLLPVQAPPFASLMVPALLVAAMLWRHVTAVERLLYLCFYMAIARQLLTAWNSWVTGAHLLEAGASAGAVLLMWWARAGRRSTFEHVVLAAVLTGVGLTTTHGAQITGRVDTHTTDVTIAQRAYETRVVEQDTARSVARMLVGGGPGATMDMSVSPDRRTLQSAGRELHSVDDAHLLTTHMLLKLGWAGVIWLVLFLGCLVVTLIRAGRAGSTGRIGLGIYAAAMLAYGIPAATNALANPLLAIVVGALAVSIPPTAGQCPPPAERYAAGPGSHTQDDGVEVFPRRL